MTSPAHNQHTRTFVLTVGATSITGTAITGWSANTGTLCAILADHSSGSPGTISPNTPGDWTQIGTQVVAGNFDVALFYNLRGGANPDTQFNFSTPLAGFGYAEAHLLNATGVNTPSFFLDGQFSTPGVSSQPNPPSVTYASNDVLIYTIAMSWAGWASAPAVPTNYSATNITNGGLFDTSLAWRQLTASTTEDPGVFGAADGADSAVAMTVAFAGAAAAAGVVVPADPGQTMFFGGSF